MPILNVFAPGSRLVVRATGDQTVVQSANVARNGKPLYFIEPPVRVHDGCEGKVTVVFTDQVYLADEGLVLAEAVYSGEEDGA